VFGKSISAGAGQRQAGPPHRVLGRSHAQPGAQPELRPVALDLGKLFSVPGTEAKELFLPREAVLVQVQATPELSFAGQYFFDWEQARIRSPGSFLGFNDTCCAAAKPSSSAPRR
jgi:hypothetical protein